METLPMCSVCHNDPPINAVKIDCNHIFCFLCIKSVSETAGACPLCRKEIDDNFNFQQHQILGDIRVPQAGMDGSYWFYEGYRGWWLYDAETHREIDAVYLRGAPGLHRFIAGAMYVIDLNKMVQHRKDDAGRTRKIKHTTLSKIEGKILGMAGLKGQEFTMVLKMMKQAEKNHTDRRGSI